MTPGDAVTIEATVRRETEPTENATAERVESWTFRFPIEDWKDLKKAVRPDEVTKILQHFTGAQRYSHPDERGCAVEVDDGAEVVDSDDHSVSVHAHDSSVYRFAREWYDGPREMLTGLHRLATEDAAPGALTEALHRYTLAGALDDLSEIDSWERPESIYGLD